jgi:protein-L-isoaspartate(D-aspartate) O-methyltransferase
VAEAARAATLDAKQISKDDAVSRALRSVPRERFTLLENVAESAHDRALPLSEDGGSTLSALHAYAIAFRALGLKSGDAFLDLGGGSGYGAALAAEIVGPEGSVLSLELHPTLAAVARENLAGYPQARVEARDAHDVAAWAGARKVYAGFAVPEIPEAWERALPMGGVLVAPVGQGHEQVLTRLERTAQGLSRESLGAVRYVPDRTAASLHEADPSTATSE